jgi:nicotinamidase-related amidase
MRHEKLLNVDDCLLMVVDLQEAFAPHILNFPDIVERSRIMIEAARLLNLPVIATEQYPKGLGRTVEPIRQALGDCRYYDKLTFSCFQDPAIIEAVLQPKRRKIILIGIETHVCIAQTALDLLANDRLPYVVADAVSARRPLDHQSAMTRMRDAGVLITTSEATIMEWLVSSRHEQFRAVSKLIK